MGKKKKSPFVVVPKEFRFRKTVGEQPFIELTDEEIVKKVKSNCVGCSNETIEGYVKIEIQQQEAKKKQMELDLQQQKEENALLNKFIDEVSEEYLKEGRIQPHEIGIMSKTKQEIKTFKDNCNKGVWCRNNSIKFPDDNFIVTLLASPETNLGKSKVFIELTDKKSMEKTILTDYTIVPLNKVVRDRKIDEILSDGLYCKKNDCKKASEELSKLYPDFLPEIKIEDENTSEERIKLVLKPRKELIPINYKIKENMQENIILGTKNQLLNIKKFMLDKYNNEIITDILSLNKEIEEKSRNVPEIVFIEAVKRRSRYKSRLEKMESTSTVKPIIKTEEKETLAIDKEVSLLLEEQHNAERKLKENADFIQHWNAKPKKQRDDFFNQELHKLFSKEKHDRLIELQLQLDQLNKELARKTLESQPEYVKETNEFLNLIERKKKSDQTKNEIEDISKQIEIQENKKVKKKSEKTQQQLIKRLKGKREILHNELMTTFPLDMELRLDTLTKKREQEQLKKEKLRPKEAEETETEKKMRLNREERLELLSLLEEKERNLETAKNIEDTFKYYQIEQQKKEIESEQKEADKWKDNPTLTLEQQKKANNLLIKYEQLEKQNRELEYKKREAEMWKNSFSSEQQDKVNQLLIKHFNVKKEDLPSINEKKVISIIREKDVGKDIKSISKEEAEKQKMERIKKEKEEKLKKEEKEREKRKKELLKKY